MAARVSEIELFRVKATDTLISDLSTKVFFIEGDTLVEERIPYNANHWERGRVWHLSEVEILLPKQESGTKS